MAKVICKGTVIQQTITTTLTAVAQVDSFSHTGAEVQTTDVTTLDTSGAGREYLATGYTEGGSLDFTLQFDPNLSGHQSITDDVTTPTERVWAIVFADAGTTSATFACAGVGFGFTGNMDDVLKADVSLKLDQLLTYPT